VPLDLNNPASFERVKQYLQQLQKKLQTTMIAELFVYVYELFVEYANAYMREADIGENVKQSIETSWTYAISGNILQIRNSSPKAAYVEFGVGIVGQENPHENASSAGYEYNVPSPYKAEDGSWWFSVSDSEMNIPAKDITSVNGSAEDAFFETRGTEAVMFAFKAVQALKLDLQTPNGKIATKWNEIVFREVG
jgi:hypothetical protein